MDSLRVERVKLTDAVATLRGPTNWRRWEKSLQIHVESYSSENWKLIVGEWTRPKALTDADAEALRKEYQTKVDRITTEINAANIMDIADGQLTQSIAATTAAPDLAPVKVTVELVLDRAAEQEKWDAINNRCISWIHNTVASNMQVYVSPEMTAFAIYSALKKVCVSTTHQAKSDKLRQFLTYAYGGSHPFEFVTKWHQLKEDYLAVFDKESHPPPELQLFIFMNAICAHGPVNLWLNTYTVDKTQTHEKNLEDIFQLFIGSETRRLANNPAQQPAANSAEAYKGKKGKKAGSNKPWCEHHKRHGHSYDKCYNNPANKDKPRGKGKGDDNDDDKKKEAETAHFSGYLSSASERSDGMLYLSSATVNNIKNTPGPSTEMVPVSTNGYDSNAMEIAMYE